MASLPLGHQPHALAPPPPQPQLHDGDALKRRPEMDSDKVYFSPCLSMFFFCIAVTSVFGKQCIWNYRLVALLDLLRSSSFFLFVLCLSTVESICILVLLCLFLARIDLSSPESFFFPPARRFDRIMWFWFHLFACSS